VPITTKVVSSNPVHGEVYSIQHYVHINIIYFKFTDTHPTLFQVCCQIGKNCICLLLKAYKGFKLRFYVSTHSYVKLATKVNTNIILVQSKEC
jgi:hypothetical protein